MKLRNGFVSNSSSSSFIVAVKGKDSRVKLEIEVDLADYGETISDKKQLLEYYKEYHGYNSEEDILNEYCADEYKEMLAEINNGNSVIVGSFASDSGDALEQYLCDAGLQEAKGKSVVVIHSEAGY